MGIRQEIIDKVEDILGNDFEVQEVSYVPDLEDSTLTFGNTGKRFEATVLYIDMRGSTEVLNAHNRTTVAKIHMAYFHTILRVTKSLGGEVRSFNGDSVLVFFRGTTKQSLSTAVKAAMQITYMLSSAEGIRDLLAAYETVDFGIGVDDGTILCTKVGVSGTNNRDLIWIGNAVNKSVVLSDLAQQPRYIAVSKKTYDNLTDEVKYHTRDDGTKVNMWNESSFTYNSRLETYYYTSYRWTVS